MRTLLFRHTSKLHAGAMILAIATILILVRNLNPFSGQIWLGHDETQGARIAEFSLNLKEGYIPPRIAPHFSENHGFPIFNHYAPAAYWITSAIHLMGFTIPAAIKLSYALALILGAIGMFCFVYQQTKHIFAALISSLLYASSPYVALEIFVRANLAEMWVFALLPITLALLNWQSRFALLWQSLSIALLLTAHNILSLLCIPLVLIKILTGAKKGETLSALFFGVLFTASFLLPAFGELRLTHAVTTATQTRFWEHYLCLTQLWSSPWGFAGSAPGCSADGMSFMLGKIAIIGGIAGTCATIWTLVQKTNKRLAVFNFAVVIIGCTSIFMTLSVSSFLWNISFFHLAVIQFPWRFLLLALWGCAYLSGWGVARFKNTIALALFLLTVIYAVAINAKYFSGQMISTDTYNHAYLSDQYIANEAAYHVPEYLPLSVNVSSWLKKRNHQGVSSQPHQSEWPLNQGSGERNAHNAFTTDFSFKSSQSFYAPIHYASYWHIVVDGKRFLPHRFDLFGEPYIPVHTGTNVRIEYHQTPLEIVANLISLTALCALLILSIISYRKALHKPL